MVTVAEREGEGFSWPQPPQAESSGVMELARSHAQQRSDREERCVRSGCCCGEVVMASLDEVLGSGERAGGDVGEGARSQEV